MNAMMIISTGITIVILGFLYWRIVKREIPRPVGWVQALLPIAIGLLSMPMTLPISMSYLKALAAEPEPETEPEAHPEEARETRAGRYPTIMP